MQIKGNYVEKHSVKFVTEDMSLEEVYLFLLEEGYRCIPVLDKEGKHFLGNVYKVHILEYEKDHSLKEGVSVLIKDKDQFILEHSSFFEVFFSIKQLPFIAVADESRVFKGILTHTKVLEILEDSWGLNKGGYALTLATNEYKGALVRIATTVNKYTTIQSLITLDNNFLYLRRIIVTLPKDVTEETLEKIKEGLDNKGFKVVHIEEI